MGCPGEHLVLQQGGWAVTVLPTRIEIDCDICSGSGEMQARDQRTRSDTFGDMINYPCTGCHLSYGENRLRWAADRLRTALKEDEFADLVAGVHEVVSLLEEYQ